MSEDAKIQTSTNTRTMDITRTIITAIMDGRINKLEGISPSKLKLKFPLEDSSGLVSCQAR